QVNGSRVPEEMRRDASRLRTASVPGSGVPPDDLVDPEARQRLVPSRTEHRPLRRCAALGEEPLKVPRRLIPERTETPLVTLAVQPGLGRRLELEMLDAKIGDF